MIRYSLVCENDHEFDGWFRNSGDFDAQVEARQVACPLCDSVTVTKALMAPGIPAKSNKKSEPKPVFGGAAVAGAAEYLAVVRKLRKHVENNAEYVGERFPEEARKIHNEEAEQRGIFGEASLEEAQELHDEGIEVYPLPVLPEDHN